MQHAMKIEPDPYDPGQPKKLLAEAGYPNGFDAADMYAVPPYFATAEAIGGYLGAIGIKTRLRTMERAAYFSALMSKKLKGVCFCSDAVYGNASTRMAVIVPTDGIYAYGGWPDVDELFKRQLSETDSEKREEMLKKSLADFVASGKGLAGLHSATDTYHNWKDYNKMMGGAFDGHPWHEKVPIKNVEPKHPLNAAFDGKDFEITDEIYQFRRDTAQPTERKFLLVLDVEKMKNANKGNRKEAGPYVVSWVSSYEKGRTFYCSLGHRQEIFWNPAILKHYLAGIQYVLGDLEADTTPTAQK